MRRDLDTFRRWARALEDEASEALARDFLEVLRLWDVSWLPCALHHVPGWVCSATWLCPGPPWHELALVGSLPTPGGTSAGGPA